MSGIVAIASFGHKPADRGILLRMTHSLAFRGPDGSQVWTGRLAGLGHTKQAVSGDETRSVGVETLGTGKWITADVRLDAREELADALRGCGRDANANCTDAQLLLHAYEAWSENCLSRVFGDFVFVIWDELQRELFCACDHFGVRRLYFAQTRGAYVCSNSLECLGLYPGISTRLNEMSIADFLLFGVNQCESTTAFAEIQRLPRGHFIRFSAHGMQMREYWRPPTNGCIRYKKSSEYVEHFSELLGKAVADRTRGKNAGILLSGGLDSSSVAAFSHEERKRRGLQLHAFIAVSEADDEETKAARTVAAALDIPLHALPTESASIFEGWHTLRWPEPVDDPLAVASTELFAEISKHVPVVLSGEGSDNLMEFESWPYLRALWGEGRRVKVMRELTAHVLARFLAPDGLRGPLRRIARKISGVEASIPFPKWINKDFALRLNLQERWLKPPAPPADAHPLRPRGYASLFFPQWSYMFEREDAAFTKAAVEVRYPFLDVRIINFLLAIPAMPWCFRKFLLREAVRGRIPERVRRHRKMVPLEDPLFAAARRDASHHFTRKNLCKEMSVYVDLESLSRLDWNVPGDVIEMQVRPWCLNRWLIQVAVNLEAHALTMSSSIR